MMYLTSVVGSSRRSAELGSKGELGSEKSTKMSEIEW